MSAGLDYEVLCNMCPKMFPVSKIHLHMKKDHKALNVYCPVCPSRPKRKIISVNYLLKHVQECHSIAIGGHLERNIPDIDFESQLENFSSSDTQQDEPLPSIFAEHESENDFYENFNAPESPSLQFNSNNSSN